jgi:precorrin-2 methylase
VPTCHFAVLRFLSGARGGEHGMTAFHRLTDEVWAALDAEATALLTLIGDREPTVYGRYGHWWEKLDGAAAETRVLGG